MTRRLAQTRISTGCEDDAPAYRPSPWQQVTPGDLLWVRENFAKVPASAYRMSDGVQQTICPNDPYYAAIYAAGWERSKPKWTPCVHMPLWASRLTLEVTAVKIERLQDISDADALAEGMQEPSLREIGGELSQAAWSERQVFSRLWKHLHGPDAWDANPEVVALSFTVHQQNIDACKKAMAA